MSYIQNHYDYDAVGKWLYSYVAGIRTDDNEPGYKHIHIHPIPGGGLTNASARIHSVYGEVESSWEIIGNQFNLIVSVHPNTHVTVTLPNAKLEEIRESGKLLKIIAEIRNHFQDDDAVIVHLASGRYQFVYKWTE